MDEAALPLVSIAIPAYNHGEFLVQAINSALAQAYPRPEMLVVDDRHPMGCLVSFTAWRRLVCMVRIRFRRSWTS